MLQYAVFVISGGAGNVQCDPVDQLGKYLVLIGLVVHLMPSAGIQPQGHIGELGLTEQLVDGGNRPCRSCPTGSRHRSRDRRADLGNAACPVAGVHMGISGEHIPIGGHCKGKIAFFVSGIFFPDLRITAEPCVAGGGIGYFLAIGAHAALDHELGDIPGASEPCQQSGQTPPKGHQGAWPHRCR